jgi:hypothetical protein
MKKRIKYVPKLTGAKTEYREINQEDMSWIQQELIRWLSIMAETDQYRDPEVKYVRDQWWHRRSSNLPKGREGQNTPCSFIGGLVNNLVFGQQRDLTDRQMEAIMYISHIMGSAYDTICSEITFQIGFEND